MLTWYRVPVVLLITFLLASPFCHGKEAWVAPAESKQLTNPSSNDPASLRKAKKLYEERCLDCHGSKGKGDGPGASDLDQKPAPFSDARLTPQTDGELYWKITKGRKPMPSYQTKLSDEQRWQLVNYLRSLAARNSGK
jgi:mono/diheme cytochrome c family protein